MDISNKNYLMSVCLIPLGLYSIALYSMCKMPSPIATGVAQGGHSRAFALPSLNFALPSEPSFYLKCVYMFFYKTYLDS